MVQDRINKANRAAFVLKKALSVGQNVSVKLAMTLFDKQISPILLYGCPLWAISDQYCAVKISMDVNDIPANKMSFIKDLFVSLNVNLSSSEIISIRTNQKGDIFVRLKDITCRGQLLSKFSLAPMTFHIEEYCPNKSVAFEKPHTNFVKFSLGVSKFESNTLTLGELGRFPVELKAIRQSILYWLRLEQGTENPLLNLAFRDSKFLNMNWLTNIQQLLSSNGLGNVWENISKLHKG